MAELKSHFRSSYHHDFHTRRIPMEETIAILDGTFTRAVNSAATSETREICVIREVAECRWKKRKFSNSIFDKEM